MANCVRCGRQLPGFSFRKVCQWCVQHEAAQRGEDQEEAKQIVMPVPWARRSQSTISLTQILLGANVAVYLAMALSSSSLMDFPGETLLRFGANFGPYTLSGDWWRLLTYMFLHAGILHIAFNMWCLWDLGALCESLYGRWTYFAVYLITGVTGGLSSIGWNPGVLSVGASGAIFGLCGALISSFYLGEFSLPSVAIGGTLKSLIVFAVFNLFFGSMFSGVDNAAHIGGLVSGLLVGALIAKLAPQHDARRAGVLIVSALCVVGAGWGVRQWRGAPMRMYRAFQSLGDNQVDSVTRLQELVREQPKSGDAHFGLAQAYFQRRQYAEAQAEFQKVVELEPQNADARFDLGIAYLNQKKLKEAQDCFAQIIAQDANNVEGHYGLGLVAAESGNYQAALLEFKAIAAQNPRISGFYFEMGNAYAGLHMYDDAIAAYLKEKDRSADDPDLENALADAYQAKGMMQQAQDARNRAQQLKSNAN